MSCTCNHFPSVPRLASTRRGSPTRYIYLVKLRDIWGITWKLCSIYLDKWKDGTMCSRNCIEVRLMEREDVKQTQYWEFINGPTLSLSLLHQLFLAKESFQKREKTNMVRWDHLTKIWSHVRKRKKDNQKSLVRLAGAVAGILRRGLNNWRRRGRSWQNGNRRTNCPDLHLWNLVGKH